MVDPQKNVGLATRILRFGYCLFKFGQAGAQAVEALFSRPAPQRNESCPQRRNEPAIKGKVDPVDGTGII